MKKGFSIKSFQNWSEANRADAVLEDHGYSDTANPVVDEMLARIARDDLEARLARRLAERTVGDAMLHCAGLSPVACDIVITAIHDQLNGVSDDLSKQRADLRQRAAKLAPHNITEIIGGGKGAYTDEAWEERDCLIYAYGDAVDELEHFIVYRNELRELLRETGFHDVARLRKQTNLLSFTDEEFDCLLERLAEAGLQPIAQMANAARERQRHTLHGQAPYVSSEAKRKLVAKLEGLATSSNLNEAATAQRHADEIKAKYDITSSDPFDDLDIDELFKPIKLTPAAELAIELGAVWDTLRPLGDFYYSLENEPGRMKSQLEKRIMKLAKMVQEHGAKTQQVTIVERKRSQGECR